MPNRPIWTRSVLAMLLSCLTACARPAQSAAPSPASEPSPAAAFDLQGFIDDRVAAGDTTIVIPPGRHLVTPRNREHLRLQGLRNIVIDGTGAELVCTETTRAITIENCENLTLRGLVIDYDPLPFTQARITAISADKTRLEIETISGYPDPLAKTTKLETFDPATNELRGRITFYNTAVETLGPGRAALVRSGGSASAATEKIGDIAVLDHTHAPGGTIPHAIMATDSRGLVFENVTLYAGVTFGFFESGCDGSRYLGCRVIRRPPDLDYARRGHPRLRSLNADAFHSKHARVGPRYERCVARHNGDDSIAINGDFHLISRAEQNTLRVLAKNAMNMRVGDSVQIFTHDGRRLADKTILSLAPDGPATAEETAFINDQSMDASLRRRSMQQGWLVTLDAPVGDTPPGSLIASADAIGNGFVIRDCELGHNRARGILVKAGRGEITGNTLEGTVLTAILVSPEFWWLEAGLSDDLLIADNTLRNLRGPGIVVTALGGDGRLAPAGTFRNLTVRGNTVSGGPSPGMLITSVAGLVAENNTVSVDPAKSLHSWEIKAWGREGLRPDMRLNNR